ncbi:single-stranded DNA-binding protein [Alkalihalophilus pseudofirmus]|uniref:ERF family protein n=1 Tax=Alkalihalophilus pseudofirmus TaxID=79885 RepID=UPI000951AE41|nr:single-stranded DNA-binding protein [Alkalihalophilus pseudofirmus]
MNIYQKLIEVRKVVLYLKKESKGGQYDYTGSSQVLGAVREKLDELNLLLIPSITDKRLHQSPIEYFDKENRPNKRTITYFTELDMTMTWVNADNPEEKITSQWYAQGVDIAGEKGVGKALTYGEKYFLLKFFNIATDKDDPDAFQQKTENSKPPKLISQAQLDELEKLSIEFGELRNQPQKAVMKALGIVDINKLPEGMAFNHIGTLKKWIDKAKQEAE